MNFKKMWLYAALIVVSFNLWATEIAMVTSLNGAATFSGGSSSGTTLRAFIKLREGDQLKLKENSRLQVVFFGSGRHETWQGAGLLDVGSGACTQVNGSLKVEIKTLPAILVKQMSKTPAIEDVSRTAMLRLRSFPADGAINSLEKTYADYRAKASADDNSPELYLLAGYFEQRQYGKLTDKLKSMEAKNPQDVDIATLKALYTSAIARANESARPPANN